MTATRQQRRDTPARNAPTPPTTPAAPAAGTGGAGEAGGGACADGAAAAVIDALTGDLDTGFAELYRAYRGTVFSTALRLSGRWAEAEDLAADAFLRAYRALCGYGPERLAALRPRAWLLTIVTNLWRNGLRSASRRPVTGPIEDAPEPPDPAEGVEAAAIRQETGRELSGLLQRLSPAQRSAVVLRHVADLPVGEIAEILDVPEGTVKSHISRGLARLRALHPAPPPDNHDPTPRTPTRAPTHDANHDLPGGTTEHQGRTP